MKSSRKKDGRTHLRFDPAEASLLLDLPVQLRQFLLREDRSDPALVRLLPNPSDNARVAAEYRALVGDELRKSKLERIDLFESTLQDAEVGVRRVAFMLSPEAFEIWVGFINDMRLLVGTRVGITEEWEPDFDAEGDEWLYLYLTSLQGQLIEIGF